MDYNIIIYLKDESEVTLPVSYDKEYTLRTDVTKIGVSGILQKVENDYLYYPPHMIEKIEVIEKR